MQLRPQNQPPARPYQQTKPPPSSAPPSQNNNNNNANNLRRLPQPPGASGRNQPQIPGDFELTDMNSSYQSSRLPPSTTGGRGLPTIPSQSALRKLPPTGQAQQRPHDTIVSYPNDKVRLLPQNTGGANAGSGPAGPDSDDENWF